MEERDYPESWADRLDELSGELARIERACATEDVAVKTYPDKTTITLTYTHIE